jgi:uncharacterized protein (DUF1330 family)
MAKKGYWMVFYRTAADPSVLQEYAKAARPAIENGGGRILAGGAPTQTYESGTTQTAVLIEFASVAQAIAVYEGQDYQEALKIFAHTADRDIRIMESLI